ncbi:threonine dehydratase [Roseobacteraceae bacterium NS-SX3]
MVLSNFQQAVQIGLVPVLAGFAAVLAALILAGVPLENLTGEVAASGNAGGLGLAGLFMALVIMVTMLWIVVSWHRFVLLEEYPSGWVPPFRFDRILSYLGHGIMISLLALIAFLPFTLLALASGRDAPLLIAVLLLAGIIAAMIVFYRLVPLLPAAAIGKPLKLKEAWTATQGANGTIFGLMIIMLLFNIAVQVIAGLVSLVPVLGPAIVFAASLVLSLVSVSVLTTFYGHYVEGRPV